jgi:hypothetical protein
MTAPSSGTWPAKAPNAREAGEREAVEAAHLEGAEHLVRAGGVLDGVDVIAADAVCEHDLTWLEIESLFEEVEEGVYALRCRHRSRVDAADDGEFVALLHG